ncbi:hypothetical protein GCM10007916_00390 [Psychromonas marina]|uniref:Uncharacterized protein n=1 Tax=Psychromonas marina TaxID=88364 RepID=A0ABQ6DV47_9GAMM|nr:hypothetical protein [Psychromonas marina]GLS88972.1 hypothetical protein GCM10007916_00390 [Psychromonas marina]
MTSEIIEQPVPPMLTTAKRFIDNAWLLPLFEITSAESSLIETSFITELSAIAKLKGIEVHYIDFKEYEDPIAAFTDNKNENFKKVVEEVPHGGAYLNAVVQSPTILIFDNCDYLAPLNCSITYTLRSILTTQKDNNIKSIFIAKQKSLDMMFSDNRAAFYHSNFSITERLV